MKALQRSEDEEKSQSNLIQIKEKTESISQWEAQLIQWVRVQKDAHGYLKAFTMNMTEELDVLKMTAIAPTLTVEKDSKP